MASSKYHSIQLTQLVKPKCFTRKCTPNWCACAGKGRNDLSSFLILAIIQGCELNSPFWWAPTGIFDHKVEQQHNNMSPFYWIKGKILSPNSWRRFRVAFSDFRGKKLFIWLQCNSIHIYSKLRPTVCAMMLTLSKCALNFNLE